jgi:predicted ATP-binding protein involved in virulence
MKIKEHKKAIAADLYLGEKNLIATSAETGFGKDEVLEKIAQVIDLRLAIQSEEFNDESESDEEE